MKIHSLVATSFCLIQLLAFTACQTAPMKDGDRAPASTPPGLTQAVEGLSRAANLTKLEVSQLVEAAVLNGTSLSSVASNKAGAMAIQNLVTMLQSSKTPALVGQFSPEQRAKILANIKSLRAIVAGKPTIIADLKKAQAEMALAAASGNDFGNSGSTGLGAIPGAAAADPEVAQLMSRMGGQLRAAQEQLNKNIELGVQRNPANEKSLRKLKKTAAMLNAAVNRVIVEDASCIANGDLGDPEAIENFVTILETMVSSNDLKDTVEAWSKASIQTIGKDSRCNLVAAPCKALSAEMGKGCET